MAPQAYAALTHPGAPPPPLGGVPWPRQLGSGRPKVADCPRSAGRHHDDEALTKNIGLLTRRFSLKPGPLRTSPPPPPPPPPPPLPPPLPTPHLSGEAAPEAVAVVKDAPLDSKSHQRVEAMLEKSREWSAAFHPPPPGQNINSGHSN